MDIMRPIKVAFYGRVFAPTGYGAASRAYIHALHKAGVELSVVNLKPEQKGDDSLINSSMNRRIEPDFHLFHFLPPMATPLTHHHDNVIISTAWETDTPPKAWLNVLSRVREVWVPCDYNVSVFKRHLGRPVFRWPHTISPQNGSADIPDSGRLPALRDSDFVFYSIFVWQERKCPEGLIEAFLRAFPHNSNVVLILKVLADTDAPMHLLKSLRERVRSDARVEIVNGHWSDQQIEALAQRGDCYVSLHRGEGWCYPLFDAACRGKPVIATGYSGPLDYLSSEHHFLVRHRLVPVEQNYPFYNRQMQWAEPDLNHAAELMREVYNHRESALQKARSAADRLNVKYSSRAIGELGRARMLQIMLEDKRVRLSPVPYGSYS